MINLSVLASMGALAVAGWLTLSFRPPLQLGARVSAEMVGISPAMIGSLPVLRKDGAQ